MISRARACAHVCKAGEAPLKAASRDPTAGAPRPNGRAFLSLPDPRRFHQAEPPTCGLVSEAQSPGHLKERARIIPTSQGISRQSGNCRSIGRLVDVISSLLASLGIFEDISPPLSPAQNSVSRKQRLRFEEIRFECRPTVVGRNVESVRILQNGAQDRTLKCKVRPTFDPSRRSQANYLHFSEWRWASDCP
jgi:hypothetical protein